MKAIKIDCKTRTVTIIEVDSYQQICSGLSKHCKHFICPMVFETNDVMYADYYAGLNGFNGGFMLDGWVHPVLGNAIIVGTDDNGDLANVIVDKSEIDSQISFISKDLVSKWFFYESDLGNISFSKN